MMLWIIFYYNSLPDMPRKCLLFDSDVMHRDFFMCNPTNTGHYQYPKFESLSYDEVCHKREVCNFLEQSDPDKYVIFYTRHTTLVSSNKNKIVGYFKVGEETFSPRGFFASEAVLLPKRACIEINYSSRGVPVSWGHSSVRDDAEKVLSHLQHVRTANIFEKYVDETRKIMRYLNSREGIYEIVNICQKCEVRRNCFWGKRSRKNMLRKLMSLYG